MKKTLFLAVVLCMLCACCMPAWADAPYTEKLTPVYTDGEKAGELTLRFYSETPNVPYLGMGAFSRYMWERPLTLRENEDGTCALVNAIGEEILCDAEAGTMSIRDWNRFFDLPMPIEGRAKSWKDMGTQFVRITAVEYEGEAEPVTLDFAKYGIKLYADGDDVYLPVSVLSNTMTDIATNCLLYNGENLYADRFIDGVPADFFDSERIQAELKGQDRPDDLIQECYAELCFNFDHFYGHPGIAPVENALAEKGLDRTLADLGPQGEIILEGLLSPKLEDYLTAMYQLFTPYLFDGHTVFCGIDDLWNASAFDEDPALNIRLNQVERASVLRSTAYLSQILHMTVPVQRAQLWGDEIYREYGSTAIIRFDSFMPDEAAWAAFYSGEGTMPEDSLGLLISGLQRASENPAIKNVIIDESCNGGGSSDAMMLILALTTGQDKCPAVQEITGQNMIFTFEADTNFDGVFDEKDKEIRYDFNYGVLVSRASFSMANTFPVMMQADGAVLIGEPSSGGGCCVQLGSDAEGFRYYMSSAQWLETDFQFNAIEDGCRIDLPIEPIPSKPADILFSLVGLGIDEGLPSFENFYDDALLDGMMNDWFAEEPDIAA